MKYTYKNTEYDLTLTVGIYKGNPTVNISGFKSSIKDRFNTFNTTPNYIYANLLLFLEYENKKLILDVIPARRLPKCHDFPIDVLIIFLKVQYGIETTFITIKNTSRYKIDYLKIKSDNDVQKLKFYGLLHHV